MWSGHAECRLWSPGSVVSDSGWGRQSGSDQELLHHDQRGLTFPGQLKKWILDIVSLPPSSTENDVFKKQLQFAISSSLFIVLNFVLLT